MNQSRPPDRPSDDDIDARFAAIVAGWDDEAPEPVTAPTERPPASTPPAGREDPPSDGRPARAAEHADGGPSAVPSAEGAAAPTVAPAPSPAAVSPGPLPPGATSPEEGTDAGEPLPPAPAEPRRPVFDVAPDGWRVQVTPEEDEDDTFEPPDPPLPRGDLRFWGAIVGLVLGPLLFVVWALTSPHSTNLPLFLGGLGTAAGFGALISQLPQHRDEDDDGARV